ncbi:MAG: hypothetical protein EOP04_25805 [Proteobacteria bacterium]|nr:MAG: hypothetical protein EOP04_25805 [Pseudomonadota bacterium]
MLSALSQAWDVVLIFTIPIGGGIPAGVVLGNSRGMGPLFLLFLYLVSDLILAALFEPLMMLSTYAGKRIEFMGRINSLLKKGTERAISRFGSQRNPFFLILISFGIDPMTGRAAALAAGHGFLSGWAIAIAGDLVYFTVIMASTLWLHDVLGDGQSTTLIIMVAMFLIPEIIRHLRKEKPSVDSPK